MTQMKRSAWGNAALTAKVLGVCTLFGIMKTISVAYAGDWKVHNQTANSLANFLLHLNWFLGVVSLGLAVIGLLRDQRRWPSVLAACLTPFGIFFPFVA
jgi:hypothetical protein